MLFMLNKRITRNPDDKWLPELSSSSEKLLVAKMEVVKCSAQGGKCFWHL
jgi:hypothetical protein